MPLVGITAYYVPECIVDARRTTRILAALVVALPGGIRIVAKNHKALGNEKEIVPIGYKKDDI